MKEIIIRTNYSEKIGLGHLFRTKYLSQAFNNKNYKSTFVVDKKPNDKAILSNSKTIFLNNNKFNQIDDARSVYKIIKNKKIEYIIVDDYRINEKWENFFYNKGYKIIVIDDLANRKHKCDFLIDSGWHGLSKTSKRYQYLKPKKCIELLGPKYSIINPKLKKIKKEKNKLNILIYFGGGNHIVRFYKIIKKILTNLEKNKLIKINIVLGTYADPKKLFFNLKKKFKNLKIIKKNFDLTNIVSETDFYIGSNSSIIYELSYLNIPRILICLNRAQKIDINEFQKLGNYFYFENKNKLNNNKFSKLINIIINNFKRSKKLHLSKSITLNLLGAKTIVNSILQKKYTNINQQYKNLNNISVSNYQKVTDSDINNYLHSRNLSKNKLFSFNKKKIQLLDHYIWWLTNKRKIFSYKINNKVIIYLWCELIIFKNKKFWTCGWHTTENEHNLFHLVIAYKLLLNSMKKISSAKIIGIAHKKNKFVIRINKEIGFKQIKKVNKIDIDFLKFKYKSINSKNCLIFKL